MAPAIVVGIGQPAAGDDGVGLVVARALAERGVAVRESADASILLPLLEAGHRVVIVDAVLGGGPPGSVVCIAQAELVTCGVAPLSSHGLGVAEALAIAATLYGCDAVAGVAIVGIAIEPPVAGALGLSAAVAAAIGPAAKRVLQLATSPPATPRATR